MPPYGPQNSHNQFAKPPQDPDDVFRVNAAPPSYEEVTKLNAAPTATVPETSQSQQQ
jgi:hypothetical protein